MPTWRFILRLLRNCVVASLLASLAVLIVLGNWRPVVWESFVVSLCYSLCIALPASVLPPIVVHRIGKTDPQLILALSAALMASAAIGSLVAGALLFAIGFGLPGRQLLDLDPRSRRRFRHQVRLSPPASRASSSRIFLNSI